MNRLSEAEHAHIPYLVILYKYLEIYKAQVKYLIYGFVFV